MAISNLSTKFENLVVDTEDRFRRMDVNIAAVNGTNYCGSFN